MANVINILRDREYNGYMTKKNKNSLYILADYAIMRNKNIDSKIKTVNESNLSMSSIFGIEFSNDGALAATSHTNRSISIIKLSTMKKIGEINSDRTAWTMAFHKTDNRIIATGNLGGQVAVYIDYKLYQTFTEETKKPIASICFHPELNYLCFGLDNRIVLWDYETDKIVHELDIEPGCSVRYIKFTPINNMLITGISTSKFLWNCKTFQLEQTPTKLFNLIFKLFSDIIKYFQPTNIDDQILSNVIIKIDHICSTYLIFGLNYYKKKYNNNSNNQIQDVNPTIKIMLSKVNWILSQTDINLRIDNTKTNYIYKFCEEFQDYYFNHHNPKYRWKFDLKILKNLISGIFILISTKLSDFEPDFILEESCKSQYALQVWDIDLDNMPNLQQDWRNIISTCSVHNDPTVSISKCGKLIGTRKRNNFNIIIEVHSLEKHNLGEKLHEFETDYNCISLSFSPSCKHLLLGVRSDKTVAVVLNLTEGNKLMTVVHKYFDLQETINCAVYGNRPGDGILIGYQLSNLGYIRHY